MKRNVGANRLTTLLLAVLVALVALPGLASAATKEHNQFEAYYLSVAALAEYEATAVDAFEKVKTVNAKNRKTVLAIFTKTVLPNYGKFLNGLKKVKPGNAKLVKIHANYVKGATAQHEAFTAMKNALAKSTIDSKAYSTAKTKLAAGKKLIDKWSTDIGNYYNTLKATASDGFWSDVLTLYGDFDTDAAAEQLSPYALDIAHAYADAILSGNSAALEELLGAWIAAATKNNGLSGADASIEQIVQGIEKTFEANDEDVLAEWAEAIQTANLNDLELAEAEQSNDAVYFSYSLNVPGFDESAFVGIDLVFVAVDGEYVLDSVAVY